ncbi:MAG: DASH family cryptochrome [Bacteroidota bacterium]
MSTHILWFRNDLRTRDHEGLVAASEADALLPVYCIDPALFRETKWGFTKTGPHRTRFLLEALADLRRQLQDLGSDLVVRVGRAEEVIPELAKQTGATTFHASEEVTTEEVVVEEAMEKALDPLGVEPAYYWGHTLYHPDDVPIEPARVPDVFTKFRKIVEKRSDVRATYARPDRLPPLPDGVDPGPIPTADDLGVAAIEPDERAAIVFRGGETEGMRRLEAYLWAGDHLKRYKETRNGMLGPDYSSKFSAWLAHGCLSPRMIYEEVKRYESERVKNNSTYWMVFELIWRDFFRYIGLKYGDRLFYKSGPLSVDVKWRYDADNFERWASGTTGIPFIDANMRELEETGFMSNRGRQNVASFLAKNLNLDWRMGAAWFEHHLVDYDVTSNWGNWAYAAGVGNDPRDRYFNINSQASRYDEKSAYIKHWLPELSPLPPQLARAPWEMTQMEQSMHGVVLGANYPTPMIDLERSYAKIRG